MGQEGALEACVKIKRKVLGWELEGISGLLQKMENKNSTYWFSGFDTLQCAYLDSPSYAS